MIILISFIVLILLFIGLWVRHKYNKAHIIIMSFCFLCDVSLVLVIELTRNAIETALNPHHPFLTFHIIISVLVLVFYVIQIILGIKLLKHKIRPQWHKWCGISFIVLRITNFVTSLYLEKFL